MKRLKEIFYRTKKPLPISGVCLIVVGILFCIDIAFNKWFYKSSLAKTDVVIFSNAILKTKINIIKQHQGLKVVVLGDSLVVGRTMLSIGDENWKEHTLSSILQTRLDTLMPESDALVVNLGLDGSVPADIKSIAQMLIEAAPDIVIFDCGLRSFSADFSTGAKRYSREWLAPKGIAASLFNKQAINEKIETTASDALANNFALFELRDYLQSALWGSPLKLKLEDLRDEHLIQKDNPIDDDADLLLLLKAKKRFSSIRFDGKNPQLKALRDTLEIFSANKIKCLLFYASEHKGRLSTIIDEDKFQKLKSAFENSFKDLIKDDIAYCPNYDTMPPERYIDHVHVDKDGYVLILDTLWPYIKKLLK